MKIWGLSLSQIISAIIVGLILSFIIITICAPHEEPKTVITSVPTTYNGIENMEAVVSSAVQLAVGMMIMGIVLSLIATVVRI
jgi:hypothetical protein